MLTVLTKFRKNRHIFNTVT